jgi:hypothetical protein
MIVRVQKPAWRFRASIFLVGVLLASGAEAETVIAPNTVMDDRFTFYIGGFFPQVSSDIRLDAEIAGGIGDTISLEDTLGLEDSKSVLWGGFNWRMARRHTFELEAFQLNRSGTVGAVTDPFQIGNSIVQVGARVETEFDLGIARLTYGYSFIKDEKKEAVVKGGIHWASVDVAMRLSGAVLDVETMMPIAGGEQVEEDGDISAPLPHLGMSFNYAITPKLLGRVQALGFVLSVGDYSGLLIDSGIDIAYTPWKHFGFGGGIRFFDLRLEAENNRLDGEFEFDYWGPTLFVVASF